MELNIHKKMLDAKIFSKLLEKNTSIKKSVTKIKNTKDSKKKSDTVKKLIKKRGGFSSPEAYAYGSSLLAIEPDSSHISLAIPTIIMLYGIGAHNQVVKWQKLVEKWEMGRSPSFLEYARL